MILTYECSWGQVHKSNHGMALIQIASLGGKGWERNNLRCSDVESEGVSVCPRGITFCNLQSRNALWFVTSIISESVLPHLSFLSLPFPSPLRSSPSFSFIFFFKCLILNGSSTPLLTLILVYLNFCLYFNFLFVLCSFFFSYSLGGVILFSLLSHSSSNLFCTPFPHLSVISETAVCALTHA